MSLPGVSGLLVAEKRRRRGLICSALAQAVPHPKTIFMDKNGIQGCTFAISDYTRHRLHTRSSGSVCYQNSCLRSQSPGAHLDRLDFKVEGNQGKYEALRDDAQRRNRGLDGEKKLAFKSWTR